MQLLRSHRIALLRAPRTARARRVKSWATADSPERSVRIDVHGRHMDVGPDVDSVVRTRRTLRTMLAPEVLESEGSVESIDVRLMPSQARVTMHPVYPNKHLHDTYLQRGSLEGLAMGGPDWHSNFEMAVEQLENKLHRWDKSAPYKKDYRKL